MLRKHERMIMMLLPYSLLALFRRNSIIINPKSISEMFRIFYDSSAMLTVIKSWCSIFYGIVAEKSSKIVSEHMEQNYITILTCILSQREVQLVNRSIET